MCQNSANVRNFRETGTKRPTSDNAKVGREENLIRIAGSAFYKWVIPVWLNHLQTEDDPDSAKVALPLFRLADFS